MFPDLLQAFAKEVRVYLSQVRQDFQFYLNSARWSELKNALDALEKIKDAAFAIGFTELANSVAGIYEELKASMLSESVSSEKIQQFLEELSKVEKILDETQSVPAEIEVGTVDLEHFDIQEPQQQEDFEIDKDLFEVFAAEADEHLQNITHNLSILEKSPEDEEALSQIRRSCHTLKGSAGIIGLRILSELAHKMEDVLDSLARHPFKINKEILETLLVATDCLEVLTFGEATPQLKQKASEIQKRLSEVQEEIEPTVFQPTVFQEEISLGKSVEPSPDRAEPFRPSSSLENQLIKTEEIGKSEKLEKIEKVSEQAKTVIRVSLERLDELIELASEVSINYSFFEAQLLELKKQVEEIKANAIRASRLSSKIETTFGLVSAIPRIAETTHDFDSLEFDRYNEFNQTSLELTETASDAATISNELSQILSKLNFTFNSQKKLFDDLHNKLNKLKIIPFSTLSPRLQRTVKVIAEEEKKNVELIIENGEMEIDSEVLHAAVEPLLHLLRNAVAHGIETPEIRKALGKSETGKIIIRVSSEGNYIAFQVSDDGKGISVDQIKEKAISMGFISPAEAEQMPEDKALSLIFISGLSTASKIDEISGRGLGLDVVKACLQKNRGKVEVSSTPQKGTTFKIFLPKILNITKVLPLKVNGKSFAFPIRTVRQMIEMQASEFDLAKSKEQLLIIKGKPYKPLYLSELLNLPTPQRTSKENYMLLLIETPQNAFAVAVETLTSPQEVIVKPPKGLLEKVKGFVGASILSDGQVMPILDITNLLETFLPKPIHIEEGKRTTSVLVVDDSPSVRKMNEKMLKDAGLMPITAKDGIEALEILESTKELPDVILTDIEMPRMDGYELLATLKRRERFKKIPVVMITSRTSEKHRQKALELGAAEYVTKPFDYAELVEKIKKMI
jgi:chemosensory pili system protein ChpA (sensor histidine kinase/response regulator)